MTLWPVRLVRPDSSTCELPCACEYRLPAVQQLSRAGSFPLLRAARRDGGKVQCTVLWQSLLRNACPVVCCHTYGDQGSL